MVNTSKDGFWTRLALRTARGDGAKAFVIRGGYGSRTSISWMGGWAARMRQNVPMTARFYYSVTQAAYRRTASPTQPPDCAYRHLGPEHAERGSASDARRVWLVAAAGFPTSIRHARSARSDWNVTVEKEIMPNTVARAGYFGNHSTRLEQLYSSTAPRPLTSGTHHRTGAAHW